MIEPAEIARRRLVHQHLWAPQPVAPEAVVARMGAMQAQEIGPARWAIGQRALGLTDPDVQRAYADGRILRTHLLRPTWHFACPQDLRWLLTATAPGVRRINATMERTLGVEGLAQRSTPCLAAAVAGGHRTREELATALAAAGLPATGPALAYLLMEAELNAVLCSGIPRSARPGGAERSTYAAFDERVPSAPAIPRPEALARLATLFFTTRNPATRKDFMQWATLTAADANLALACAGLTPQTLQGRRWYGDLGHPAPLADGRIDLVQSYDECLLAYTETKDIHFEPGTPRLDRPPLLHAVLQDGRIIGHWRPRPGKTLTLDVLPLRPFRPAETDALDAAAQRYASFVDQPATWSWVSG